ncbi:MAG: chorismate-binding protein, partial [Woeseia sp.]
MLRQIVLRDSAAGEWLTFASPVDVLTAGKPAEVMSVLRAAERRVEEERLYAVGFLTYEAASGFDEAYRTRAPGSLPLVCLGLFREPARSSALPPAGEGQAQASDWQFSSSREDYLEKIAAIRNEIAEGNTYQVNYTVRLHAERAGDSWELFRAAAADAPFAVWIDAEDYAVVSASPELFFRLCGERILCKPMKGTAPRGMTLQEDRANRRRLGESAKDKAENVMITDMVRNDVGRIAVPGSVRAEMLFDIARFRTVWQMTSTVTASTTSSVTDILQALFPSASVTGAPKVASMNLIAALEQSPRGVYTGAI